MSHGKIISVEEVNEMGLARVSPMNGDNGSQLGIGSVIHRLMGSTSMDGYKVTKESPPKKTPIWQTIVTAWFIASVVMGLGFLFYKLIFWR